jgi:hypothetical protein
MGISDEGKIIGIEGKEQDWSELLFKRALGAVKPKVNWKSYPFEEHSEHKRLICLDIYKGDPVYYFQGKPYIRDGTDSRPAEPEEVKERFRQYFAAPVVVEDGSDSHKSTAVSQVGGILIDLLIGLNLYREKDVNPALAVLRSSLESLRDQIENRLGEIRRVLGEGSDYYQALESISGEILSALKTPQMMDGGISWNKWLDHLKSIEEKAYKTFDILRSEVKIEVEGLDDQRWDTQLRALRWLDSIDDELSKFTYEADDYVRLFLRLHFILKLKNREEDAQRYKEVADELERLSWARTNTDYQDITTSIPILAQKIRLLDLEPPEAEILKCASEVEGAIYKINVAQFPSGFIRAGSLEYDIEDSRERSKYLSALDTLIEKGLVRHVSKSLYQITNDGWKRFPKE